MNTHIRTFGIMLENDWIDKTCTTDYLDYNGYFEEWQHSSDQTDAAEWWLNEWKRIFPGVNTCHHGMSAQSCVDPINHWDTRS